MEVSRKSQKARGTLLSAHNSWRFLFKMNMSQTTSLRFLEKRNKKTNKRGGRTKHKDNIRRELLALLICCIVLRHSSVRVLHKGQPKETSWHELKQETLENRQLGEISSADEIVKDNKSSEVYVQCNCFTKRSRLGTVSCWCGKKLGGLAALQEKNAQVTNERGCHIIRSLKQLRTVEQGRRGQCHDTSEEQKNIGQ